MVLIAYATIMRNTKKRINIMSQLLSAYTGRLPAPIYSPATFLLSKVQERVEIGAEHPLRLPSP